MTTAPTQAALPQSFVDALDQYGGAESNNASNIGKGGPGMHERVETRYAKVLEEARALAASEARDVGELTGAQINEIASTYMEVDADVYVSFLPSNLDKFARALLATRASEAAPAQKDATTATAIELSGVAEALAAGGTGMWRTCSGCYESEDGYPVGHYPYSNILKCDLGGGCSDCGGIGAVWDTTDYEAMGRDFEASLRTEAAPVAPEEPHTDDMAVDTFARVMKNKMGTSRAKGRGGWEATDPADLSRMLREHVEKGDPIDVANLCMMLWHLQAVISPSQAAPSAPDPAGWFVQDGATHTLEGAAEAGTTYIACAYRAASKSLARLHDICLRYGCGNEVMHEWLEYTLASQAAPARHSWAISGMKRDPEGVWILAGHAVAPDAAKGESA